MTGVWEDPSGLNYETDYTYDALGNLTYVNQKGNNTNPRTRTFTYDSLSEITSAVNPKSGTILYAYDADGNLITKTAPLPNQTSTLTVTTNNTYDKLNRLISKGYKDGTTNDPYTPPVQFGYDGVALTGCTTTPPGDTDSYPIGRATAMCDGSGATSWIHDTVGRAKQELRKIGPTSSNAKYVTYVFNLDGSLANLTTPPMKTVVYTYSGAGRATKLLDSGDSINFATGATYAPPGELTGMTLGSATGFAGFTASNAYNDRLQPILLSAASPTATVFSECFDFHLGVAVTAPSPCSFSAYATGDNGNVYSIVNNRTSTRTQSFAYDSLNRIASGQSSGTQWGETFTIDPWGNMTNETAISGKTNHEGLNTTANPNNQLAGFGYDAAGNMTSNGSVTYVYDAENRLVWTSGYRYIYDGKGQRVEKCAAASATTACPTSGTTGTLYWRGTGSDTLDESDLGGNAEEEYIFFNGQRIARRDVSSTGATIAVHYYFSDHLGSHGVVENATGTTCEQDIDYYPYGGIENDYCPIVAQNYKFTGKERDAESGLDNFGARYDSSSLGRFMTPDWAAKPVTVPYAKFGDPQTLNLYSYVENGPVNRIDPDGHNIAVIENGPTVSKWKFVKHFFKTGSFKGAGNPIGHTAFAVTGQGVFSSGNTTPPGTPLSQYMSDQSKTRDTKITVMQTTPEQDKAAVEKYTQIRNEKGENLSYPDNCASRTNEALDAAGIPSTSAPLGNGNSYYVSTPDPSIPGTAGNRAEQYNLSQTGSTGTVQVPKGEASLPRSLQEFDPPKEQ
jgi:RHS repeat-associated protein